MTRALLTATALVALTPAPASARTRVHVVEAGDLLGDIAAAHGCTVRQLKQRNGLSSDIIHPGDKLKLPKCDGKKNPYVKEGRARTVVHTVIPGEFLGSIAARYGVRVADLRKRNRLRSDRLRIGQKLRVRSKVAVRPRRQFDYTVAKGDTLAKIGARYDMTWPDIRRMNPGVDPRRLRIGQRLKLWKDGPQERSETVGKPQQGALKKAEQLPAGPGYYRRRPGRAWGANETITLLLEVIRTTRAKHPGLHDLAIGDISRKDGGPIQGHSSHQSGRDVDIGLYFHTYPSPPPKGFVSERHPRHKLHVEATWALLVANTGTNKDTSKAEYVFLDHGVQRRIYEWAVAHGKPKKLLSWMFQYPAPASRPTGVVRHEPRHADHLHIRFRCPRRNPKCR